MGSSGDDYSVPPQQPAPPSSMTQPFGQSTPDQGWQGINFLDNNTATGITPGMDAQIKAMSGPPPGAMGPPGGGMPTQTPPSGGLTPEMRMELARIMNPPPQPGIGRSNVNYRGPGGPQPRMAGGGGGANRGGYSTSGFGGGSSSAGRGPFG